MSTFGWLITRLNHALRRTRRELRGCHRCVPRVGSLGFGHSRYSQTSSLPPPRTFTGQGCPVLRGAALLSFVCIRVHSWSTPDSL